MTTISHKFEIQPTQLLSRLGTQVHIKRVLRTNAVFTYKNGPKEGKTYKAPLEHFLLWTIDGTEEIVGDVEFPSVDVNTINVGDIIVIKTAKSFEIFIFDGMASINAKGKSVYTNQQYTISPNLIKKVIPAVDFSLEELRMID